MRYTLEEIAAVAAGCVVKGISAGRVVTSVFIDSRNMPPTDEALFIAVGGKNHDGHSYINQLYAKGVRAFLIEQDIALEKYPDAGFIRVDSSVSALQALAADYRSCFKGTVVGITGSNGKTVVKEWIASLAPPDVKLFRSPKSYNSQIGVPLSVLMMEGDEQVAVFEAGISEKGEMARLEKIIRPDVGLFVNIGGAHQENFASVAEKAFEKAVLFCGSRIVIYSNEYPEIQQVLGVGTQASPRRFVDYTRWSEAVSGFSDKASRENAAAALAVCEALGFDMEQAVGRLSEISPIAMRLELKQGVNDSVIINDSYNSDINSLVIALDYLASVADGRQKVLILSEILQSGIPATELYRKVSRMISSSGVFQTFLVGNGLRPHRELFPPATRWFADARTFLGSLHAAEIAGKAVLLKGNHISGFDQIAHSLEMKSHTTTLEVDLDAMLHNLNVHKAMAGPGRMIMAMVKASAYGHGGYEVASLMQREGVDYLAVAFADEGISLREKGITMPIVVLNADSGSFGAMVANRLEPEIYSFTSLNDFISVVRSYGETSYPVHIKIDTGMHRLGFDPGDADSLVTRLLAARAYIRTRSVFSHLAASDDPGHDNFTQTQIELFREVCHRIGQGLGHMPLRHIANSAAIHPFPQAGFDMVRLGIGLYGVGEGLKNVASLKTRIVQMKNISAGETVGYGRSGMLEKEACVATLPIGYADGVDRHLGLGAWTVLVNGVACPTVGRICMDTCMIDVSAAGAAEGDEAVIYGATKGNTVYDMASALETIPYEIMTSISERVKRIYIKE